MPLGFSMLHFEMCPIKFVPMILNPWRPRKIHIAEVGVV